MKKLILIITISLSTLASEKEALQVIQKTAMALQKELQAGMKKSPVDAVEICNTRAMPITKMYQDKGIEVGRVSLKNRNPTNTVKDWMKDTINAYENGSNKKAYTVVRVNNNKLGIIKPIKTMPLCLNCHGIEVSPKLSSKIKSLYPKDKAIGYKVGDTRGYFWATYPTN